MYPASDDKVAATAKRGESIRAVSTISWLARMLARKPVMLVIVALANKNAWVAWALITKGGIYRAPTMVA